MMILSYFKELGFLIILNIVLSLTLPINNYLELECSSQDDSVLNRSKRSAISLKKYPIWPNQTIHYIITCKIFTPDELNLIKDSLREIEQKTCIKFVRLKEPGDVKGYINVQCEPTGSCKSELGYKGKPQILNLQVSHDNPYNLGTCMIKRKVQHEFMHALGFRHEHNSPNRSHYVKIISKNIADGWSFYFEEDNSIDYENYGCPYDYYSIMQVDSFRHSISNELPIIIPLKDNITTELLGKSTSVSTCDIIRINNMYCNKNNRDKQLMLDT